MLFVRGITEIIFWLTVVPCRFSMASEADKQEFPDTVQGFGYGFNAEGKLRKLKAGTNELGEEGFEFTVSDSQEQNQKHYEALGEVITKYVYELLESTGQLVKLDVPVSINTIKTKNGDVSVKSFIFASKDALTNPDHLLILIHGSGVVRAGQWARSLIINDSLNSGTQLPYIHRAQELGYGVMVLNTNDNYRDIDGEMYCIKNSGDPLEHAEYVWEEYVKKARAQHIAIVAHSYGGVVTMELAQQYLGDFKKRVAAVAFTDSVHNMKRTSGKVASVMQKMARNWVSSSEPLDTAVYTPSRDIERVSAGTPKHEMTSASALESVFAFVQQAFIRVSRSHEL